MKKIESTSKLVLALTATLVAFSTMAAPDVVAQSTAPPLRDNSVTSEKIKDGEVKTNDLANNAVTSPKIADGTIQEQDIADGVIPDGVGVQPTVHTVIAADAVDPHGNADAICPDGEILTGGGFSIVVPLGSENDAIVTGSGPNGNRWVVTAENFGDSHVVINSKAVCMDFSP